MRIIEIEDPRYVRVVKRLAGRRALVWADTSTDAINRRAVNLALKHIGTKENPAGSNMNPFGEYWEENGVPWCGLFAAFCLRHAGHNITRSLALKIDYVPEIVAFGLQKKHRMTTVHWKRAKPGDMVCFEFTGDTVADHVGLFVKWVDKKRGIFLCVEGNTSKRGSQSNGGAVELQVRRVSQTQAFVRKLRG